jgi:hypothetical protein
VGGKRHAHHPVENHRFDEETSWADEYTRIPKLFEDNLRLKRDPPTRDVGSSAE